ncbi:hypothetical protein JTB14_005101 [Gonioctena quinquepunctata]|nr:hypothetical protein JTB14_005101 [Gonioctena quinquepunctata]
MDDIVILSSTEEEGLERLRKVFQVAKDYGLDIKKRKCKLLKTQIEFLGFIIDDGRAQPSNDETLAIKNYPQPSTLEQIQSFLGSTGYFMLHIYKQVGETELHTVARKYGYGARLMQKSNEDSRFHPVTHMSKKTTPAKEKYSSYELEVSAIIQAMSHLDALSRHRNVMTMTLTEEDGVVERLRRAQELDEHILAIKKILSTEDYDDFFVKSDILYKFVNGRELIVVPKTMQTDIIKEAHEIGHFALPKTEEVVNRELFIPKLKEKIQKCLGNCIHCILGIQNLTITTGVPRGNGQAERVNRIIIPVLIKLSLEDPGRWFKYVERVQRALNSTIQRSIGTSPFEILTGVKMGNKEGVLIKELLEEATIQKFNENREDLRSESKKQILKVQEENKRINNLRRRKPRLYKKGDLVAIGRTQFGVGIKI